MWGSCILPQNTCFIALIQGSITLEEHLNACSRWIHTRSCQSLWKISILESITNKDRLSTWLHSLADLRSRKCSPRSRKQLSRQTYSTSQHCLCLSRSMGSSDATISCSTDTRIFATFPLEMEKLCSISYSIPSNLSPIKLWRCSDLLPMVILMTVS